VEGRSLSAVTHLARLGVNYTGTGILGLQKIRSSEKSLLYSYVRVLRDVKIPQRRNGYMKEHRFQKYIYGGITAVLVILIPILVVFMILERDALSALANEVVTILSPVIYGAVLAFLIAPIFNAARDSSEAFVIKYTKNKKLGKGVGKTVGTCCSILFLAAVVVSLLYMVIPQLYESILGIVETMPTYVQNIYDWLTRLFENNPPLEETVLSVYDQIVESLRTWASTSLIPSMENLESLQNLEKIVGGVSNGVMSIVNLAKNLLIGLIVMVYLLNIKERLGAQGKKIAYAFLPVRIANETVDEFRYIHRVFSGFIIGKLIDSLIIGILCFIAMNLLKLPFALLISVIVGVTNIIPFFGPFIGAIPSAVLVFLVNPMQCVIFLLLILAIQQFDGNILGPRILGNATGLSSFWVLFSILLFGGLFGFIGMIIAVPLTAVLFDLFSKLQYHFLRKKNLSPDTRDYYNLRKIDEEKLTFIKRD